MTAMATPPVLERAHTERWSTFDPRALTRPAALIFNPHAGQKLGIETNSGGPDEVQDSLRAEGVPFDPQPTQSAGHATVLARHAVNDGRQLVIVAGGDGTVNEVAHGLAKSETVLGLMPLGSIMNVARTLWIPRDLPLAARTLAEGKVLSMDMGRIGEHYFLEAAGVGLDAGLFGYFDRLENGASRFATVRAALRFMRQLGSPRVSVEHAHGVEAFRARMISVANGPYVGAAYAIAPGARIDDGILDVVIFRRMGILRLLVHLAMIAGGRPLPPPPEARLLKVRSVTIRKQRGRPLPVHADGESAGITPVTMDVVPGALKVIVGPPQSSGICAWDVVGPIPASAG